MFHFSVFGLLSKKSSWQSVISLPGTLSTVTYKNGYLFKCFFFTKNCRWCTCFWGADEVLSKSSSELQNSHPWRITFYTKNVDNSSVCIFLFKILYVFLKCCALWWQYKKRTAAHHLSQQTRMFDFSTGMRTMWKIKFNRKKWIINQLKHFLLLFVICMLNAKKKKSSNYNEISNSLTQRTIVWQSQCMLNSFPF